MSAATPHPATLDDRVLLRQCEIRRLRRSGPGGQHRNKVETAIHLRHIPTKVESEANERRSQAENQRVALRRLRINLALEIRGSTTSESVPSELWSRRCQNTRISVNPNHADFPVMLAEALDVIAESAWDVKQAANKLGCTLSQLTKLLKLQPRALALVNTKRKELGLHTLK